MTDNTQNTAKVNKVPFLSDLLTAENIEKAAKALWDSEPHTLLKKSDKYSHLWNEIPESLRKGYYRKVRIVTKALCS